MDPLVERIRGALGSGDLNGYADLLAPDVTWGAPGDPQPACRNRRQVLAWYQRGFDGGTRADVVEATRYGNTIIVGLRVLGRDDDPVDGTERWQALHITDELVADIRGFEDRASALAYAGLPSHDT